MEYNTTREKLVLRENGRNFHKLIEHVKKMGHRVPLDVFIDMYNKTV